MNRPLRVFLCHSSADKPAVRELYAALIEIGIDAWLDEEKLIPGQQWRSEISRAVRESDAVIICLSKKTVTKEGFVQREIKFALDVALEKPENTIFLIPARLDNCKVPNNLTDWHWVNLFESHGYRLILEALEKRANSLGLKIGTRRNSRKQYQPIKKKTISSWGKKNKVILSNDMEFMRVPAGKFVLGSNYGGEDEKPPHLINISYDYWIGRYPITNEQYNIYVKTKGIDHPVIDWKNIKKHPVAWISWDSAIEYCQWLNNLFNQEFSSGLVARLPTEPEWEKAARGPSTSLRRDKKYPWGNKFDTNKCNSNESVGGGTSPVGRYSPQGDSPFGCADMVGNVLEWTQSEYKLYPYILKNHLENQDIKAIRVLRGGSFDFDKNGVRVSSRSVYIPGFRGRASGFRVVIAPPLYPSYLPSIENDDIV